MEVIIQEYWKVLLFVFSLFFLVLLFFIGKRFYLIRVVHKAGLKLTDFSVDIKEECYPENAEVVETFEELLNRCSNEQLRIAQKYNFLIRLGFFRKKDGLRGLPFYVFVCMNCQCPCVSHSRNLTASFVCKRCDTFIPAVRFKAIVIPRKVIR